MSRAFGGLDGRPDPSEMDGEAARRLLGATEHAAYPLAVAVGAVFAPMRSDAMGAEELCRRATEANTRRWTARCWQTPRLSEEEAGLVRVGGDPAGPPSS